jgi:hypothetical protein
MSEPYIFNESEFECFKEIIFECLKEHINKYFTDIEQMKNVGTSTFEFYQNKVYRNLNSEYPLENYLQNKKLEYEQTIKDLVIKK